MGARAPQSKERQQPDAQPALQGDEAASMAAVEALRAHEATLSDMESEYWRRDAHCVRLATDLAPLRLAASPRAAGSEASLHLARRERDDVRYLWRRRQELLQAAAEKFTAEPLRQLCEDSILWGRLLLAKRDVQFVRHTRNEFEGHTNLGKTNGAAVKARIDEVLAAVKAVKAMRLAPLHEVRAAIRALHARVELMLAQDIPCTEEVQGSPRALNDLRFVRTDAQPARGAFYTPFSR
jgi:hypothetical protein